MEQRSVGHALSLLAAAPTLRIDLSHFERSGAGDWHGACPIHKPEKSHASFSYSTDGRYKCSTCLAQGRGVASLAMHALKISFNEAAAMLDGIAPSSEVDAAIWNAFEPSSGAAERMPKPSKASHVKLTASSKWLVARVPDAAVRQRFGVFCYNNPTRQSVLVGKVLVPILGFDGGELHGYLVRNPNPSFGAPKYFASAGLSTRQHVFGARQIRQMCIVPVQTLFLVDSPFTAMKLVSLGLPAVSPCGWGVSAEQLEILWQLAQQIVCLADRSKREQARASSGLIASRVWVRCPALPDGMDDPELLSKAQILAL